ncbi:chemotaxis signal transduction protein [Aphanothece sacrum FPU3]|nr:chemotaxis signal transduction protein [Aphanothece sacrum FPU3]
MALNGFSNNLTLPSPTGETRNRSSLEQFLRFDLVPDTTLMLPVAQLTEVLTVPLGQIVPIPHMPPWVMGIYNWRGEILWMVDLGHLLGLNSLASTNPKPPGLSGNGTAFREINLIL